MKIVNINGSPKGAKSNTHVMSEALLKGFASGDTEITNIFLSGKRIDYCRGCYSCWTKTPGKCIIDDDMSEVIREMQTADLIILGTPVYFNNISGTLKVFIDRLMSTTGNPHKTDTEDKKTGKKYYIMIANCGFPDQKEFEVISLWIKNLCKLLQLELIGEFYKTSGKELTNPTEQQIQSRDDYLAYLESCGRQYQKTLSLTEEQIHLCSKNIKEF